MKIVIYFDCNGNRSLASAECGLLIKPAAAALPAVSNIQGRQECLGEQLALVPGVTLAQLRDNTDKKGQIVAKGSKNFMLLPWLRKRVCAVCRPWNIATLI